MVRCIFFRHVFQHSLVFYKLSKPKEWQVQATLLGAHQRPVYSVDWSHEHGGVVTGGGDNKVTVYMENASGEWNTIQEWDIGEEVNCVRWKNKTVAAADDLGRVHLWTFDV